MNFWDTIGMNSKVRRELLFAFRMGSQGCTDAPLLEIPYTTWSFARAYAFGWTQARRLTELENNRFDFEELIEACEKAACK